MKIQRLMMPLLLVVLVVALALPTVALGQKGANANRAISIDGSTTVGPIAKAFKDYYERSHPGVNITVSESGSGNGAKSLRNGVCDIAIMSRCMKAGEFKAAGEAGFQPVAHVVALDAIAVIVHPANPISELSMTQLKDIYSGKITNWRQLGGPNMDIVVIGRETNSGTFASFQELVMGGGNVKSDSESVGSNGAARQRVQSTKAAIAYVGLGFVDRKVKALSINGVEASPETVQSGDYPIARPLYMFTNGFPKLGTDLHRFATLHLTEKGQEIVESIGFVPVTRYK